MLYFFFIFLFLSNTEGKNCVLCLCMCALFHICVWTDFVEFTAIAETGFTYIFEKSSEIGIFSHDRV